MTTPPPASAFLVYFVCTGNQARSPLAAAWTARALEGLPVRVGSGGTLPRGPSPVLPDAGVLARELGLDLSAHRSSNVAAHDLSRADLVVGFELHHVAAAVVEGRAPAGRAFLLKEIVRLARNVRTEHDPDPVARARRRIELADALRRATGHVPGEEIKDPAGRKPAAFRRIVREVADDCDAMIRLLFAP